MSDASTGLDILRSLEAPPSFGSSASGDGDRPPRRVFAAAALGASLIAFQPAITPIERILGAYDGELNATNTERSVTAYSLQPIQKRIAGFHDALMDGVALSEEMVAQDEGPPINRQILAYALNTLVPIILSTDLPTPLFLPLQNGGIGAEWHATGMNIELRFRAPYNVYAVLEDARGVVSSFHGRDPHLLRAYTALRELGSRSAS